MKSSTCKKCFQYIEFIKMEKSGKMMPVNPKPLRVITERGEVINGYLPHWAECEFADDFRQKKEK